MVSVYTNIDKSPLLQHSKGGNSSTAAGNEDQTNISNL